MRYHRVIILVLISVALASCKKGVVSSSSTAAYSEDLSVLRPELKETSVETIAPETNTVVDKPMDSTEDLFSIKNEMDSVNQLIAIRNSQKQFIDGYTIQVYTGNDADVANKAKDYVEVMFPELDPVVTYHQPSFKVKVGSYHNRLEAYKVFESLKKDFPLAILIPERIKIAYE